MQRKRIIAGAIAGLLLLGACGDDGGGEDATAETTTTEAPTTTEAATTTTLPPDSVWVAETKEDVSQIGVYAQPGDPDPTEPCQTWEGQGCLLENPKVVDDQGGSSPQVFLVDGMDVSGEWLPVWLPIPPNESQAFIHADDVELYTHSYRITVNQTNFTLTLTESEQPVIETQVGLGRAGRETRPGFYYTTELLQSPNPGGAYGPFAYGISGFAEDPEVINEFGGSEGVAVLGIHGTNDPGALGSAVSSGCMRVNNDAITQMAETLPLGVPVEVVA